MKSWPACLCKNQPNQYERAGWMSYYGFTLQELRELMELRGEEAKAKESGFLFIDF